MDDVLLCVVCYFDYACFLTCALLNHYYFYQIKKFPFASTLRQNVKKNT